MMPTGRQKEPEPISAGNRRRVLIAGCLAHITHDGLTDMLYVFLPVWQQAFGLNYAQVGFMRTAFSGALALFQVPAGLLAGVIGTVPVLVAGTMLTGASLTAIGLVSTPLLLGALLVAGGIGAGTQHPLASSAIAYVCSGVSSRVALSTYNFSGDVGKSAVPLIASFLIAWAGWQGAISLLGMYGLAAALVLYLALSGMPLPRNSAKGRKHLPGFGFITRQNAAPIAALSSIGMIDNATRGGFLTLLPFLLQEKGAGMSTIALALGLVFAGGAMGKLFCGILAARVGVLRSVVVTEMATATCIAGMVFLSADEALALSPFLGIVLNGTSSVLYGSIPEMVSAEHRNEAFALFYTITIGSGAISPFCSGLAGDAFGVPSAITFIAFLVLVTVPLTSLLKGAIGRES